jgi:ribosomal protein S18 acetylase RimI-like enzyme
MTSAAEFDAVLWFLAESEEMLAGAALCWTSAFVKDLVVHESWRRRGLGETLLRHAWKTLAIRAASAVELKVESSNRSAVALYERLGKDRRTPLAQLNLAASLERDGYRASVWLRPH